MGSTWCGVTNEYTAATISETSGSAAVNEYRNQPLPKPVSPVLASHMGHQPVEQVSTING